jgi:predicted phage terminase large subunit-like protein
MNAPIFTDAHFRALLRQDLGFFARGAFKELLPTTPILWSWHLDLIATRLEDVLTGTRRRLIINIPPRYGKSLLASVAFPAFILGRDPTAEVVCVSYAQDLADKMAGDSRRLMNSGWYQNVFQTRLANARSRLAELRTPEGGSRLATSVEGMLTGRGGNIIIIDDPLKPAEAASETQRKAVNNWFDYTVTTRSNDKERGAIVIIMQRLNEDDLVGHLQEHGQWEVLALPAIAEIDERHEYRSLGRDRIKVRQEGEALHPERESLARIAEAREAMGSYAFAAQYQQRPAPAGGGIVRAEWFGRYEHDDKPAFLKIIQSWDTASKITEISSYSVCTTWGVTRDKRIFLLDVFRGRLEYPDLKRKVVELAVRFNPAQVLVEDTAAGIQLVQELKRDGLHQITRVKVEGGKEMRMRAQTPTIENGHVWLPKQAPWLSDYLHELTIFPNGRHADQVDSTSQALKSITLPTEAEGFLELMKWMALREYGIDPKDLTVGFDHPDSTARFNLPNGRQIWRDRDGYYWVTESEWESACHILVRDDSIRAALELGFMSAFNKGTSGGDSVTLVRTVSQRYPQGQSAMRCGSL